MSIERTGPRGLPPVSHQAPASIRRASTFQIGQPDAPAPVAGSVLLGALRSGALDQAGYIEGHIEQATSHLRGLAPETLEHVRAGLRELCERAPLFQDLLRVARG
jgi:hypothetical protein